MCGCVSVCMYDFHSFNFIYCQYTNIVALVCVMFDIHFARELVSHVVIHATTFPRAVIHIKALGITVNRLTAITIAISQFLLFSFRCSHLSRMLFAPFGSPILEPYLMNHRKNHELC